MSAIVAIVGRPNVGKSTLFNRMVEGRQAIVDDMSGVTRDRNYGKSEWNGSHFTIIDTGGYVPKSEDVFEKAIREQVHIAMEEADVLIFVVDGSTGITNLDRDFANMVRQSKKPVLMAVNKTDSSSHMMNTYEFYELGLETLFPISAINGGGTGELLDEVVKSLPEAPEPEPLDHLPHITVVGRPNVGKSSLVNALLGRDVNIVTPIAGTTRDSVHTRFTAFNHDLVLVDTAGLRKKARVKENVEFYSTLRSIRSIEAANVAILMIDATQGLEAQDMAIVSLIQKNSKGLVVVVNKWDLVPKETNTARDWTDKIKEKLQPFSDVPVLFVSVLEKQRLLKVLETAVEVFGNMRRKIPTHELNETMLASIARHHPPTQRGKLVRIKYVTQVGQTSIPTFLFFANHPTHVAESYQRYLENQLRGHYDFTGAPINVFFRKK
ncbi:MAG: ribosome biogenesis GTPase Der [Bacteroidia bacterium]